MRCAGTFPSNLPIRSTAIDRACSACLGVLGKPSGPGGQQHLEWIHAFDVRSHWYDREDAAPKPSGRLVRGVVADDYRGSPLVGRGASRRSRSTSRISARRIRVRRRRSAPTRLPPRCSPTPPRPARKPRPTRHHEGRESPAERPRILSPAARRAGRGRCPIPPIPLPRAVGTPRMPLLPGCRGWRP
jgi:hypothetical protein